MLISKLLVTFWSAFVLAEGNNNNNNNNKNASPKVLFLTNSDRGQASIHLATAHTLLSEYGDALQIHFASFPGIGAAVEQASRQAATRDADRQITFHPVQGTPYKTAIQERGLNMTTVRQRPGLWGSERFSFIIELAYMPWTGPEYLEVVASVREIVERVQPDLAVIDILFSPGVDTVEATMGNRSHVILSPNDMKDMLAAVHPQAKSLWHYPV